MDRDLPFKIALSSIQGIGASTFKVLLSYFQDAESVFSAGYRDLLRIPGIGPKTISLIRSIKLPGVIGEKALEKLERLKAKVIYCRDEQYPVRLLNCPDAPAFLFLRGNADLNNKKVISIVGTRKASSYGLKMVKEFLDAWKEHKPLIISGLAYGIDIKAHRSSLEFGLETIGVLAGGLDRIYPKDHIATAKKMEVSGGLLTEYPPGTEPEPSRFPARNRIIAGLSDATIVVEAANRGGALITAEMASGYNREVFALPGRLIDHYSEGCNELIRKQKAIPLVRPEDLEENLNWDLLKREEKKKKDLGELMTNLDLNTSQKGILEVLAKDEFIQMEDLSWETEIRIPELVTHLLELELKGLIKNYPGNRYALML